MRHWTGNINMKLADLLEESKDINKVNCWPGKYGYRDGKVWAQYFYMGDKKLCFYKNNVKCCCNICEKAQLLWEHMEPYAEMGFQVHSGKEFSQSTASCMLRCAEMLDTYARVRYPRKVSIEDSMNWHLGLFSDDYLKLLPDDLKTLCLEYRCERPLISDYVLCAYAIYSHKGYRIEKN